MRNDIRDNESTETSATAARPAGSSAPTRRPAPLHWWRTLPPESFTEDHLETLTAMLSRLAIIREPQWPAAVAGDGAAAVGIALRAATGDALTPTIEVAMTALLPAAIGGDPAAALVLASVIDRMFGGVAGARLADAWLAHADLLPSEVWRRARLTANTFPHAD
jgi:hypothetical protein